MSDALSNITNSLIIFEYLRFSYSRVPFIRNGIRASGIKANSSGINFGARLDNVAILDVGCGGGILSEVFSDFFLLNSCIYSMPREGFYV